MAATDLNYQFTMVDIGEVGSQSDGGVFAARNIGQALDVGLLHQSAYTVILNYFHLFWSVTRRFL